MNSVKQKSLGISSKFDKAIDSYTFSEVVWPGFIYHAHALFLKSYDCALFGHGHARFIRLVFLSFENIYASILISTHLLLRTRMNITQIL